MEQKILAGLVFLVIPALIGWDGVAQLLVAVLTSPPFLVAFLGLIALPFIRQR